MMQVLRALDLELLYLINGLAGQNARIDALVNFLRDDALLKAGPLVLLWWVLWWRLSADAEARARLLAVLSISIPAIALGRALALSLPYRPRPLHEPALDVQIPIGMHERTLDGWNSIPSDHAVMFVSIAAAFFLLGRAVGWASLAYALVVICLPRVYSGLHYPSDILAGAAVGIVATVTLAPLLTSLFRHFRFEAMSPARSAAAYMVLGILSLQIATMYELPRFVLKQLAAL